MTPAYTIAFAHFSVHNVGRDLWPVEYVSQELDYIAN